MNARISQLHKTEMGWGYEYDFMPKAGEIVIYDPDYDSKTNPTGYQYARIKIGDGKTLLKDLAFVVEAAAIAAIQEHKFDERIDGGRITDWT